MDDIKQQSNMANGGIQTLDDKTLQAELAQFTCTMQYHRNWSGMHYTDGVQHLARRAGAFWLIDAIASWQPYVRANDRDFQLWELLVHEDRSADLIARRDTGESPIVQQRISYTDFPLKSMTLWVEQVILLLPSEH